MSRITSFRTTHAAAVLRRSFGLLCVLCALISTGFAKSWPEVDPADLAATDSSAAPGADIEIIFSRHLLDDTGGALPSQTTFQGLADEGNVCTYNHVRAKIFTQKGVEKSSVLKFEYLHDSRIKNVTARVVKPDGQAVELEKKDIFHNSVVKWSGTQLKSTSFAFPNLAPGDVVEYRWEQLMPDNQYFVHNIQQAAPVREFTFRVAPLRMDYNLQWFHCPEAKLKRGGGYDATLQVMNLPPFHEEDFMPPERDFRAWLLVVFSDPWQRFYSAKEMWHEIGAYLAEEFRLYTRPNGDVKAMATALIAGATSDDEKLNRIYRFCQTEISNFDYFKSAELIAAEEKRNKREDWPAANETLSLKSGNTGDINRLFGSLARAAGFEVRFARSASRDEIQNVQIPKGYLFIPRSTIAVKVGEAWRFYSPGHYVVPAGMLSPRDEAVNAFVCDEKKPWWQMTPSSSPERSTTQRKGRFKIDEEGTLTGEVQIEFNGHAGIQLKQRWWGETVDDASKDYREQLAKRLPTAEVSDLRWENLGGREYPVTVRYNVTIPGYAELAGSRMIFPTNFFEAGSAAAFNQATRAFPVFFPYAEKEIDDVHVVLPEGFTLDGGSSPANVGAADSFLRTRYKMGFKPKSRVLMYQREYLLGEGGAIAFRTEGYPHIKGLFDQIAASDGHRMIIKPKPTETAAPAAAAPDAAPAGAAP